MLSSLQAITRELVEGHCIGEIELNECHLELANVPEQYRWAAVREMCNFCVENLKIKSADRIFAGQVCSMWMSTKTISSSDYMRALREFLEPIDDISMDVPKIWSYVPELISKYFVIASHITLLNY